MADLSEIIEFLKCPSRPDVQLEAAKIICSLSALEPEKFTPAILLELCLMTTSAETQVMHQLLNALINISSNAESALPAQISENLPSFINHVLLLIILPGSILADPCCMLLNNLSKSPLIISLLLPQAVLPDAPSQTSHIDNLLEIFSKGDGEKGTLLYNSNASFHFIAGCFANISATPSGGEFLLGKSEIDHSVRISRLAIFVDHPNIIRRASQKGINLLAYILTPLLGPEDYDLETTEKFPEELQFMASTKLREPDAKLRQILVEALLIITGSIEGRHMLRDRGVYEILQKMHLSEPVESIRDVIERVVDLISRHESNLAKLVDEILAIEDAVDVDR